MKTISVILALFALASCIPTPQPAFMGPNGNMVYAITCETSEDCEAVARTLCPSEHDVVPTASGADHTSAKGGIGGASPRRLAILCK